MPTLGIANSHQFRLVQGSLFESSEMKTLFWTSNKLFRPVLVVAEEVFGVPEIEGGPEKQPGDAGVAHFLETAIGGVDAAADNGELVSLNLLAKVVVFGEKNSGIESAQRIETRLFKQHEHSRAKGFVQSGEILKEVIADVEGFIEPAALVTNDVGGHALQVFLFGYLHGAPN